ncbi:uncharacterized protein BCR38DRAFT_413599 [Pseudomassariella vexata]|uniref:Uncharacterized protein n=1 Tax=Pseudomassariella vexata TaxID=1141098 RepID=A0A1Y2DGK0_9PEZI|nr:uncharacterized protein BCR38DRAFT_413599 [Pseudomassariella vexata]ORY58204.1 hypothetical protein BCR38DRAFT_413599 [Pseudomassariella vexata]
MPYAEGGVAYFWQPTQHNAQSRHTSQYAIHTESVNLIFPKQGTETTLSLAVLSLAVLSLACAYAAVTQTDVWIAMSTIGSNQSGGYSVTKASAYTDIELNLRVKFRKLVVRGKNNSYGGYKFAIQGLGSLARYTLGLLTYCLHKP